MSGLLVSVTVASIFISHNSYAPAPPIMVNQLSTQATRSPP